MARALRTDFPGAWHHVMNKGARGGILFRCDEDRLDFVGLLADAHRRYQVEFHAYCLMGTHYHLLVRSPLGNLSKAMRHIDGVFALRFNQRHGLDGSIFKGRFLSKLVDTDGYLDRVVRYIHRNPLEAGMVEALSNYPWSSYPAFLGRPDLRPGWLYRTALEWSGVRSARQLRQLTEGPAKSDDLDISRFSLAIGSDTFVAAAVTNARSSHDTVGQLRAAAIRPSADQIDAAVADFFGCGATTLRTPNYQGLGKARLIAIGLAQEIGGMSLIAIADRYSYATQTSAGAGTQRFRALLLDEAWRLAIEEIRAVIGGTPVDERCRIANQRVAVRMKMRRDPTGSEDEDETRPHG